MSYRLISANRPSALKGTSKKRANKYHAVKATVDGIEFDSKKEAARYCQLCDLEHKGFIKNLERQVRYEITPKMDIEGVKFRASYYIVDFKYVDTKTGQTILEDVKGYHQGKAYDIWKLKAKIMAFRYGLVVREI